MSAPRYPEPMSTSTLPTLKKKGHIWAWAPTIVLLVVLPNLMESLNWSRWFLTAPAAAITGGILIYAWAKRRREAAREAAARD